MTVDAYTKFCFDKLKRRCPEYLEKLGILTIEDIDKWGTEWIIKKEIHSGRVCTLCKSRNTIERSQQMRSIDEGETLINYCNDCNKVF